MIPWLTSTFVPLISASKFSILGTYNNEDDYLADLDRQLFGVQGGIEDLDQYLSDSEVLPIKTGVEGYKLLKNGPKHLMDAEQFEPLYIHQESILEDCLRREAERVAHQENLMSRIVYDCMNQSQSQQQQPAANSTGGKAFNTTATTGKNKEDGDPQADGALENLPTFLNCDNTLKDEDQYIATSANDYTLCFESRFESGNLRRAI